MKPWWSFALHAAFSTGGRLLPRAVRERKSGKVVRGDGGCSTPNWRRIFRKATLRKYELTTTPTPP
ncbi:hypothetical protein GCM10020220_113090 [Nonomuraea rubra]